MTGAGQFDGVRLGPGAATVNVMVGSGQPGDGAVSPVPAPGWAGISTGTLRHLATAHRPLLLDQHLLVLVTVGHGVCEVDFAGARCRPGTLIWVRPGQVIRVGGQPGLDATVVCWQPEAMDGLSDTRAENGLGVGTAIPSTSWQLSGEDEDAVITEVSQLTVDCRRHRSGELAAGLLRHQLAVVLLRIALLPVDGQCAAPAETSTFRRLRLEVERSYRHTRRVEDYADRMGCSVRTLTRACLAATGRTAKQVIDDRVALQAMRLLAATDAPIADIGQRLGFSEPANFGRFFHRHVGQTAGMFRAGQRRQSPPPQAAPSMAEEQVTPYRAAKPEHGVTLGRRMVPAQRRPANADSPATSA